jgi:hypothetical protein
VRPDAIVVVLPGADHDPCLLQAVEDLELEALVPKLAVEAFAKAILPRTAGLDVECFGAELGEPLAQRLGDHLRTIVAANMLWNALLEHGIGQRLDNAKGIDPTCHAKRQALARVLVDQGHDPNASAVMGAGLDKVEAPDVIATLRSQTNA